jgi:transcriptional regulator with XRE-family HTH domain
MAIGDKIRALRLARQWTQQDLARTSHVPQAVISRLETHVRVHLHSQLLKQLAHALGCTTDYLVGMHDEET